MATSVDNLEAQYDAVIDYIRGYLDYVFTIIDRSGLKHTSMGRSRLKLKLEPFNLQADLQAAAAKVATDAERTHEYYETMVSRDQAARLSEDMLKRFPDVNFAQLVRFNEIKEPDISMFDSSHLSGIAFAMMGGIFQFLPRILMEYPLLDLIGLGFYVAAVSVIYPRWTKHGIERKQHQQERYILTFTSIVQTA